MAQTSARKVPGLVALLVPPDPFTSARERLVASGRLIPASRPLRLPRRVPARPGIHLASALSIRADLLAFIAYDHHLADAAEAAGLESLRPGT